MKSTESAKYLNVLLNLLGLVCILVAFGFTRMIYDMVTTGTDAMGNFIFILYSAISLIGTLGIVIMLKRVVGTILFSRNPFVEENIKRFRNIAYIFFALPVVGIISNIALSARGRETIGNAGSLVYGLFFNILIGCVVLVLADVFKFAMEIKEDNDLTV